MDRCSLEILERTVELAIEAMPPSENPSVAVCMNAIVAHIESPSTKDEEALRDAVTELMETARLNCHFLIAARLARIAHQLGGFSNKSDWRQRWAV
jgi:hypothetical protein